VGAKPARSRPPASSSWPSRWRSRRARWTSTAWIRTAGSFAALREGDLGEPGEAQVALVGGLLRAPAVLASGDHAFDVLSLVTTADLAASLTVGRFQIYGMLPVYPLVVQAATLDPTAVTE
jgi:hypothetical protein